MNHQIFRCVSIASAGQNNVCVSVCDVIVYHCRRSCVLSKLCDGGESRCPVCNMPSWVKDVRPNYQLSAIINNLLSLKSLITTPSIVMPSPPPITTECPVTSTSSSTGEKRNTRGETPLHAATLKVINTLITYIPLLHTNPYYIHTLITYIPLLHIYPYYIYTLITYIPLLHIYPYYIYTLITYIPLLHIYPYYIYTLITYIPLLHTYPYYIYTLITYIPLLHIYPYYIYTLITYPYYIPLLHIYPYYIHTFITYIPLLHTYPYYVHTLIMYIPLLCTYPIPRVT